MKALITYFVLISALFALPIHTAGASRSNPDSTLTADCRVANITMPLSLTARDLITKVYGFIDPGCSRQQCIMATQAVTSITPEEDDSGLWMNAADGYGINFYGMEPQVEAMARFAEDNQVSEFGYFFFFPYKSGKRAYANASQADFSGCLLQELTDMGLEMAADPRTEAIFEVFGDYNGNYLAIRLIEEVGNAGGGKEIPYSDALSAMIESNNAGKAASGRYVLVINVEPRGFTEADDLLADEQLALRP